MVPKWYRQGCNRLKLLQVGWLQMWASLHFFVKYSATMKSLRAQLHLSQQELADLLGVSRPTITLYEKGLRNLPYKCSMKLFKLQSLLLEGAQQRIMPHRALAEQEFLQFTKMEKGLHAHARKAAAQALHITMRLARMQERYELLVKKLNLVQSLLQDAQPATKQMALLLKMEADVLDAIKACAPARQMAASYRIQVLQARQRAAITTGGLARQRSMAVKFE